MSEKNIKTEYSLGIDIGGGYVRLAEISESEKGIKLENYKVLEIRKEKDGTVPAANIASCLKQAYSELPERKRKIFCLLSGTEVIIRHAVIPKMKERDLLEAIKWEIKSHVPFSAENSVFDYKLLGTVSEKGVEKFDVLVAAVPKEAIVSLHAVFESAGIPLDGISVVPFAAWNLLKQFNILQKERTTVLITIGSDMTSIVFFGGEDLEFFRELSIAGNNFTKAMIGLIVSDKWQTDISYEQAEKIKRKYGIPEEGTLETTEDNIPLSQISQLLRPVLRRFLNEIIRSFSFYKENFQKEAIDRILISGGSSKMNNIKAFLSAGLESNVANLEDLILFESTTMDDELKEALPHLSAAIGIALSKAKEMNLLKRAKLTKKTFLPPMIERFLSSLSETDNSIKVPALIGGAIVLVFALVALSGAIMINNRLSQYNRIIEGKRTILKNVQLLSEQRAIINRISANQMPVRQILAEVANVLPDGALLNSYSFTNSNKQIVITGTCPGMKTVGSMLKNIELSTIFSGTTLIEAKRSQTGGGIEFKLITKVNI